MKAGKLNAFFTHYNYSDSTIQKYRYILELLLEDIPNIKNMDAPTLAQWLSSKNWGVSFRYVALCAVRKYLRHYYGEVHPALNLRLPRGKRKPQRTLNMPELKTLLGSFNTSTPKGVRDLSMCTLFVDTGLRVSEVVRLSLHYLSLTDHTLDVIVKGGDWERKKFSAYTSACLVHWLAYRSQLAKPGIDKVYVGIRHGRGMTRDGVKIEVAKWGKRAGLKKISPHVFRRTFATLTARLGAPQSIAMLAGGWRDVKTFRGYVQALQVDDIEPYLPISAAMGINES